jgi:hypothetical protein
MTLNDALVTCITRVCINPDNTTTTIIVYKDELANPRTTLCSQVD